MIPIIIILILIIFFLSYKLYEYYKAKELFENAKWCVYYDSFHKERPEVRMRNRIFHLQHELSLDGTYRITKDELDAITEILLSFRQDVIQNYFSGAFQKNGFSFETDLIHFLEKHKDEYEYRENITYHKMHYILQFHYLKLHNIIDDNNLGVIQAKTTKDTIDNILSK